jgi:hypothetical protein
VTSAAGAAEGPHTLTVTAANTAAPGFGGAANATYAVLPAAGGGDGGGTPGGVPGTFSDNFNRPDVAPLDNGWQIVTGALSVQAGEARSAAARTLHMAVEPSLAGGNGTVGASFASADNNGAPRFGVVLRYQDPQNYYVCYRMVGGSSLLRIARVQNGVETVLKTTSIGNPARNAFFSLSCTASGTSLTLQVGTVKVSATDATFASGSVGLVMGYATASGSTFSHRADNFSATMQ